MTENNLNIHLAIQVVPLLQNQKEMYPIINKAMALIEKSGLNYHVSAMETTIEGPFQQLMELVKKIYRLTENIADEYLINIKIHGRKTQNVTFQEKGITKG